MEINTVVFLLYAAILITASFIDIRHLSVPDWVHLCILALSVCSYLLGEDPGPVSRLFGCLIPAGILLLVSLLTKGGIGGGDIKLMAASGLLLGLKKTFLALALSYLLAGLLHLVPLLTGRLDRKAEVPMVPYFTAALLLSASCGHFLIQAYLTLLSGTSR